MRETWVQSLGCEDPLEGNGYSLQYSDLENSMDCIVHGVAKSRTQLSNFHFTSQRETLPLSLLLLHECSDSQKLREP